MAVKGKSDFMDRGLKDAGMHIYPGEEAGLCLTHAPFNPAKISPLPMYLTVYFSF